MVDLRLLGERSFGLGAVLIFITGFVLYSSSAMIPILVQSQFGYDATMAGLVLSPAAVAVLVLMPVSGQLVSRIPSRYMIIFGLAMCGIGCLMSSHYLNSDLNYTGFVIMRSVQMIGIPFLFIPVSTLAFMKIPKEKSTKASSLFSLSRNLGGSVGIALVITLVARNSQTHQSHLVDRLVPGDPVYDSAIQTLTSSGIAHGLTQSAAASHATGTIYRELLTQSTILGYADTFMFLAILVAGGICAALFLPMNNPGKKPSPEAAAAH